MKTSGLLTYYSVSENSESVRQLICVDSRLSSSNYWFELQEVISNRGLVAVDANLKLSRDDKVIVWLSQLSGLDEVFTSLEADRGIGTDNIHIVLIGGANEDLSMVNSLTYMDSSRFKVLNDEGIPVSPSLYREKIFVGNTCLELVRYNKNKVYRVVRKLLSLRTKADPLSYLERCLDPEEPFSPIASVLIHNGCELNQRDLTRCLMSGISVGYILDKEANAPYKIDIKAILARNLELYHSFDKQLLFKI